MRVLTTTRWIGPTDDHDPANRDRPPEGAELLFR
jgi:hypothetical protein